MDDSVGWRVWIDGKRLPQVFPRDAKTIRIGLGASETSVLFEGPFLERCAVIRTDGTVLRVVGHVAGMPEIHLVCAGYTQKFGWAPPPINRRGRPKKQKVGARRRI